LSGRHGRERGRLRGCQSSTRQENAGSREQLLNSGHRREHFHYGNIRTDEFRRNNVLLKRAPMERSLEEVVMLFDKRLTPGEKLPSDVRERAVGSEMTSRQEGSPIGYVTRALALRPKFRE
jgi:hypothetical protein